MAAVIENSELLLGDDLQDSNGARVLYIRKQGADTYEFDRANGGRLPRTHQGLKSIAKALAEGSIVEKGVWAEFELFRGLLLLGTLFDVRHVAYVGGRLG